MAFLTRAPVAEQYKFHDFPNVMKIASKCYEDSFKMQSKKARRPRAAPALHRLVILFC
jgi:hypothetical protein